jgi:hypothetical protein
MKLAIQKHPFYGDSYIIRSISLASISAFLRPFILFLFIFSSILSLSFSAFAVEKNSQQVPAKKVTPTPVKSASSSKVVKGKKRKKSVVIKKDTLKDIDPASANSPLFNN